ncbi:MAG: polyprenol monophosphomannose synthase [Chloroflexi bacterium]|nr:polyprenol monophosphomannose synthase [Chloroflexota bacterium]
MNDEPTPAVVVPTYNEAENIAPLVRSIRQHVPEAHIIVVDDNSPDGTGQVADALAQQDPRVHVIHREGKLGLGTAYVAGFRKAFQLGADPICTMDADFSHDPRYLPPLLAKARTYDVAIGSRYVPGGGTRHWGLKRRVLSRGANWVARTLLGLSAHDCTAGFRAYRRHVLERIRPETVRADGYSYLVEILYRCQVHGFSVGEIPILFVDRRRGRSKISQREIFKAMGTVARLFFHRLRRALRLA